MISYELAATVPVESHVIQLAATPGDGVCAALANQSYLAVIDGAAATVVEHGNIFTTDVTGVGVAPTGDFYACLPSMSCVAVLGASDGSRRDIHCTINPGLICVPPAGSVIYVVTETSGESATGSGFLVHGVAALDTVSGSSTQLVPSTEDGVHQLVADPGGGRLFARGFSTISVVDLATQATHSITGTVTTSMALSPDGSFLYLLAAGPPPRVDVVNTATLTVLSSISVPDIDGTANAALGVSPDGVHLLLAGVVPPASSGLRNLGLVVKEIATGQTVSSVRLGAATTAGPVVTSPDGSLIFVPTDDPTAVAVVRRKVELHFLDVKLTIGSAPAWLVSRYTVQCTYTTLTGDHTCASANFDADGGTATGQVSDDGGHFPALVNVSVAIDFVPATGLAGVVRTFTPAVTDVGVNFLFEPDQMMQTVELIFDLTTPPPQAGDFLSVQWQHHTDASVAGSGTKFLSGQDLAAGPVIRSDITLMPAAAPGTLAVTILGRYNGAVLVTYSGSFDVANTAVVLRPQLTAGTSYTLAVAT